MKRLSCLVGVAIASASLAAAVPQTPAPAPSPTATGLIVGQVVDVLTGKPIPDATVTVNIRTGVGGSVRGGGPAGRPAGAGAPLGQPLRLLTGADGKFVLHDVPKGAVNIQAVASGYVQGAAGQARPTGPARPIDLDEGEKVTDLRISLWKQAAVTGTVLDESGEPAVGVTVRMLRRTMTNGKPQYLPGAQNRTDDRGVYRISAITPGTFLMVVPQTVATVPMATVDAVVQTMAGSMPQMGGVMDLMNAGAAMPNNAGPGRRIGEAMVTSPGSVLPATAGDRVSVYQTLFYPGATTSAQGGAIILASGEERSGVDFQLRVLPAVKVSGVLTGPGGPVGGVQVRLLPVGSLDFASDNGIEAATTQTAADGSFQMLGVPSGQYTFTAYKPASPPMPAGMANNALLQMAGRFSASGQPTALFAQSSVSVSNADLSGLAVVMTEGAKVTGRVEFLGSLPPPAAPQLRSLNIALNSVDGRSTPTGGGFGAATPAVDQDLQFKTPSYPPGRYVVSTTGVPQWTLTSVTIGGRDVLDEGFELKNSDVTDAVVTFTDRATNLTGTIRTPAGAPARTASVMIFPADYQGWISNGMSTRRSRTAVGTRTGTFTIAGLPAGDYLIAALDDADVEDPRDPAFVAAVARAARPLSLADGDRKTQDLQIVNVGRR